jgi:hypothetical protein
MTIDWLGILILVFLALAIGNWVWRDILGHGEDQ